MFTEIGATQIVSDLGGQARRRMCEYLLSGGPDQVKLRVASPTFRMGSHPSNDLVLKDPSVSRFHLEIEASPNGFRVRDLESTNGTWVNNLRIKEAFLSGPASLRAGQVTLHFALTGEQVDLPLVEAREFHGLLGQSPAMREIFATLVKVAPQSATILIEGESGTGKELVAAAIHRASKRSANPFVVLDCAAIPISLIESEFFGHERGAFTGAVGRYEGRFREADGGTLFLDEIGELPLEVQPKLLRVLETRQVRRLGSTSSETVDIRLVAATNRNLAQEVNRGTFREDLYYRLAVVQLKVPPLRERPEDIRLLVGHFIKDALPDEPERANEILYGITDENWRKLERLPWPGNVRELRNFIERTLILSGGPIEPLALHRIEEEEEDPEVPPSLGADLDQPFIQRKADLIARFERAYLFGQLARHNNNLSAAARASGLDRMNFKRLLRKYR